MRTMKQKIIPRICILIFFFGIFANMSTGCHYISSGHHNLKIGSGILVYDYKAEKDVNFFPTPCEPGFYREMLVCANQDGSFFTIQQFFDEHELPNEFCSDGVKKKATILRKRDMYGNEYRKNLPFRVLFDWDIGLSPDRTMAVCHGFGPDSSKSIQNRSVESLYLVCNLNEEKIKTEIILTDVGQLPDKLSNIVWLNNEKVFVRTVRFDGPDEESIYEILLVDTKTKNVQLYCKLDDVGMDLGLRGNDTDKIAFVNEGKKLCIIDDKCTIVDKIDFSELMDNPDDKFEYSKLSFNWLDKNTVCIWKSDEEKTPYIMYNVDTKERRQGEISEGYADWLSPCLYSSVYNGHLIVDLSLPQKNSIPLPPVARVYKKALLPNGKLVMTCDY